LLAVGCATEHCILFANTRRGDVVDRLGVRAPPEGLVFSKDGARLFAPCAAPSSTDCQIDVAQRKILAFVTVGHTAMASVLAPDQKTLYVCDRFNNDVSVIDLTRFREVARIPVEREPVAADITPDGQYLVVANHLHRGRANRTEAIAKVTIIATTAGRVAKEIVLRWAADCCEASQFHRTASLPLSLTCDRCPG
jgi:YVTN family beta-propeller protein